MKDLKGKVAVVTGAASGLGRAMALAFADEGMNVALGDVADVSDTFAQVEAKGVSALALRSMSRSRRTSSASRSSSTATSAAPTSSATTPASRRSPPPGKAASAIGNGSSASTFGV